MSVEDARILKSLVEKLDRYKALPDEVLSLYHKGEHSKIANMMIELLRMNQQEIEDKIRGFKTNG